jgi:hypothetical protein
VKYFWVTCGECNENYVAAFFPEFGFLVPSEPCGEECPDCGSPVEIGDEWEGSGD